MTNLLVVANAVALSTAGVRGYLSKDNYVPAPAAATESEREKARDELYNLLKQDHCKEALVYYQTAQEGERPKNAEYGTYERGMNDTLAKVTGLLEKAGADYFSFDLTSKGAQSLYADKVRIVIQTSDLQEFIHKNNREILAAPSHSEGRGR